MDCQQGNGLSTGKMKARMRKITEPKYHHGDLRRAVLEAALELIEESGVSSLSLREIARRIGVTTAAPYHHFKDRGELLLQIGMQGYSQLLHILEQAAVTASGVEDECEAEFRAYLHFAREHAASYAVMFSAELAQHEYSVKVKTIADRCFALVCASVARSRKLSERMSAEAALSIWALLHGMVVLDQGNLLQESRPEQERIAVQGALAVLRGLSEQRDRAVT
jgi:AcrR family transcriptional regulator